MPGEYELVNKLTNKQYTIAAAESCTGGLLAASIVNVSGASGVLNCSFVTYSNEAKEKLAGARHETLLQYGAVSSQTAGEMALGCARAAGADVGLSTTGIAGPDGGTADKPVGLVYIGCAVRGKVAVERHVFSGDRLSVRQQAVKAALDLAIHCMEYEE